MNNSLRIRPHPRPRVVNGRAFQPKEARDDLAALLERKTPSRIIDQSIVVDFIGFYKKLASAGDIDNICKTVYDALQVSKIIKDDKLIVGGYAFKCQAPTDSFSITIYSVEFSEGNAW